MSTEDGGSGDAERAVPQDADSDVSGEQVSDAEVSEVTT
jgi:hypothetical protein